MRGGDERVFEGSSGVIVCGVSGVAVRVPSVLERTRRVSGAGTPPPMNPKP